MEAKVTVILLRQNVVVYVYFNRHDRRVFNTGVKLSSTSEWNGNSVVNRSDALMLNAKIDAKRKQIEKALYAMSLNEEAFNYQNLMRHLSSNDKNKQNFLSYMEERIYERDLRESTRKQHLVALDALKRFGGIRSMASVTSDAIYRFDQFLRRENKNRSQVCLHGYHKRIKPYILECVALKLIGENPYLQFKDVRGKSKERTPLSENEVQKLRSAELPKSLAQARDLFIFCCYTGLAYVDMQGFVYDRHIVERDNRLYIVGYRQKTDERFYTPLLPPAREVLERYGNKLPNISNQKYNLFLHAIEARLGFSTPLTSHVARHTFATLMLSHDMPLAVVAKMMGHADVSTTQIYAKILREKVETNTLHLFETFA